MAKAQTAMKEYTCSSCGKPIPVGHRYWRDYEENDRGYKVRDDKHHLNCIEYERPVTAQQKGGTP